MVTSEICLTTEYLALVAIPLADPEGYMPGLVL